MRAAIVMLVLFAPFAAAASPTGGIPLVSWTYGVAGEVEAHPPAVTTNGLAPDPVIIGTFTLPADADGIYVKATSERILGARIGVSFSLRLLTPSGALWPITSPDTQSLALCQDGAISCEFAHGDSASAPSTRLLDAEQGVYEVRAYGTTNGAWDVVVFTT